MRRVLLVVLPALALGACGGGGGGGSQASTKTSADPAVGSKARLKRCIEPAQATLELNAPDLEGELPLGNAGELPAEYLGAISWANGGFIDVWLAKDVGRAKRTAAQLQGAETEALGGTNIKSVWRTGLMVWAPSINKA